MMKRNNGWYFIPFILLLAISCRSVPTYNDLPPEAGPAQEELDRLDAAMARATGARENAVAVQASVHFPDEWARAETDYQAGRRAGRATQEAVDQAVSYFMAAADLYELMAENGAEIFARDLEDARNALDAAITRARRSRQGALDAQGPTHFPGDWQSAEAGFQRAEAGERDTLAGVGATTALYVAAAADFDDIAARSRPIQAAARNEANNALREATARADGSRRAAMAVEGQVHFPSEWREAESQNQAGRRGRRTNPDEIMAAVALLNSAADGFDDIAGRSAPMAAAAMNDANREFQAAAARADRSRRAAVAVDAQTHFPGEWDRAESQNTGGRSAPRTTIAETRAATAQLNSAADGFDGMAERSGPMQARARDEANAAFQAALARADGSRQAAVAVEAQTFFPAEWRTADSQNTAARRGRRTTPEEIRNATAQLNSAADGFDDIARRSRPMFTAERNQADGALRAAMARATQSRQRAEETDAATNLPREWRNLETRHRNAENARRATLAEMRSAANLFNGVADGFDGIIQQNVRFAEENQAAALAARATAERERQAAVDARANVTARDDFDRADTTFRQAATAFNDRNFAVARNQYNQSATQFVASVREADRRRRLADVAVEEARRRSAESTAFAISTGLTLEEMEGET